LLLLAWLFIKWHRRLPRSVRGSGLVAAKTANIPVMPSEKARSNWHSQ